MVKFRKLGWLLLSFISSQVFAGGFQLHEQNAAGLGNTFAGTSALAEDASTGFYNPAGLPELKYPQILGSLVVINTNNDVRFHEASTNFVNNPAPAAVFGDTRDEAGGWFPVPAIHASLPFDFYNRKWTVGIGVTSPYGLTTSYTSTTMARYLATYSNLVDINIGPSFGVQLFDCLSFGAGFDVSYLNATLKQMVPIDGFPDGRSKIDGDDWGYGWNAGILFKAPTGTRVGVHYRSRIKHTIDGDSHVNLPTPLPDSSSSIKASITLPDNANLSIVHDFNDCWSVLGSVEWVHWSLIQKVTVRFPEEPDASIPFNFDDTFRYALAVNFKPDYHWKFRLGAAYDETPIPNSKSRTYRLPDSDRIWVGLGAQYKINECFTVDAGISHLFGERANIKQTQVRPLAAGFDLVSSTDGDVKASANLFGIQLLWNII